ncbi:MAG: hypothetical protein A2X80_01510 [Geobacteraceae bacterium GWB2_52_12]|nr:MAG: hypothetical protein A2X80_01510 [Geobacteraceae bacterium GWB2_52_12]
MKKRLLLSILATLVAASGAFAGDITGSTVIGNGSFTPSNKVGIAIISSATSYAATSAHLSGTFEYGTVGGAGVTGDPSKILKKAYTSDSTAVTANIGQPTDPASATALADGYTE